MRMLEIGPGSQRIPGFETLNAVQTPATDHVGLAEEPPFKDETFDLVYSSHCIEHIEWYLVEDAFRHWVRILKPGGKLEVWTLDAYKCMRALVTLEETGEWEGPKIGPWQKDKVKYDPYKWAVGRIMCYPKGTGKGAEVHKHRAIFTPNYLKKLFVDAGLEGVRFMDNSEVRGKDHKWVNLGVCGTKPNS